MNTTKPWNKARAVGQRKAFEPDQVRVIATYLFTEHRRQELCLFTLGIDTMLRAKDLLALRVSDIEDPQNAVSDTFGWQQSKTKLGVFPALTPTSKQAALEWIKDSRKGPDDFLFTGHKAATAGAISTSVYRGLVKSWVEAIGLNASPYSSHSLRRTKPIHLYRCGVPVERIAKLLGHKDTQTTLVYLGVTLAQAQEDARRNDLFAASPNKSARKLNRLSEQDIDRIATKTVSRLVDFFDRKSG